MLAGIVVASKLGVQALVLYLIVYLFMNLAAFAAIVARERETGEGDSIAAFAGLGRERPLLAWPMTLAMFGLAGIPATAGLIGKIYLIEAAVDGGYAWLGVMIVVGSMISLGYYLPVVAAMWMRPSPSRRPLGTSGGGGELPAVAGGSAELDDEPDAAVRGTHFEVVAVAVAAGAATLFFGIVPQPLFELVRHTGSALGLL
jgi:NADH-quinone oxidoreductase subunit N